MSIIQLLSSFSSSNFIWTEYQMGFSDNIDGNYNGNVIIPVNFPIPTTFDIYFDRKEASHTGVLGYYVDGVLNTNALSSGIGYYKVQTINVSSWTGISNIQFRSTINDSIYNNQSPSEWKVYANGILVYYHSHDLFT
jgi:hypothetical protein